MSALSLSRSSNHMFFITSVVYPVKNLEGNIVNVFIHRGSATGPWWSVVLCSVFVHVRLALLCKSDFKVIRCLDKHCRYGDCS